MFARAAPPLPHAVWFVYLPPPLRLTFVPPAETTFGEALGWLTPGESQGEAKYTTSEGLKCTESVNE
jgi:hypothetical protein